MLILLLIFTLTKFHRITQEELNDLIGDLNLPKRKAELLGWRLQQWNLLKENVRVSLYCKRYENLTSGSCDRASLTKEKKEPTDDTSKDVYSLLAQHVSGIIMPIVRRQTE